jgi:hypothetical protein
MGPERRGDPDRRGDVLGPGAGRRDPGTRERHRGLDLESQVRQAGSGPRAAGGHRRRRRPGPRAVLLLRAVAAPVGRGAAHRRQPRVPDRCPGGHAWRRLRRAEHDLHARPVDSALDRAAADAQGPLVSDPGRAGRRPHGRRRGVRRERCRSLEPGPRGLHAGGWSRGPRTADAAPAGNDRYGLVPAPVRAPRRQGSARRSRARRGQRPGRAARPGSPGHRGRGFGLEPDRAYPVVGQGQPGRAAVRRAGQHPPRRRDRWLRRVPDTGGPDHGGAERRHARGRSDHVDGSPRSGSERWSGLREPRRAAGRDARHRRRRLGHRIRRRSERDRRQAGAQAGRAPAPWRRHRLAARSRAAEVACVPLDGGPAPGRARPLRRRRLLVSQQRA